MASGHVDCILKLVVLGNANVGKTSLLHMFAHGRFWGDYAATLFVDFHEKYITIDQLACKLRLFDTAGGERYSSLRHLAGSYFRGAHGVLIVYDTTDSHALEGLKFWKDLINEHRHHLHPGASELLVGNKCDLTAQRQVPYEEAAKAASMHDWKLVETSAKEGTNVEMAFVHLAADFLCKNPNFHEVELTKLQGISTRDTTLWTFWTSC